MSQTPMGHVESLRVGTVDFVSPDEIKVLLDIEAPESVALNAGVVRPFPRVSAYVLVLVDDGYLVGQIQWLTVERSAFPKRKGVQDFGLIDLPYPLRRMSLGPLGTLRRISGQDEGYLFRRGADALPSIGSAVLLPTQKQLLAIVESGEERPVQIGTSPIAGNARVCVDPDRIFGRHLAVLGNTGSGKSCSVAGIVRWSLEAAQERKGGPPHARFVILDPNGEYANAFRIEGAGVAARVLSIGSTDQAHALRVPLWLLNTAEWVAITQASAKTQKPTLAQALRLVRHGHSGVGESRSHQVRRFLRTVVSAIRIERNAGTPWAAFPKPKAFNERLQKWKSDLESYVANLVPTEAAAVQEFINAAEALGTARRAQHRENESFRCREVDQLVSLAGEAHTALGGLETDLEVSDGDVPRPFNADDLVRAVEGVAEITNVADHVETLLIRLRALLGDKKMSAVIGSNRDLALDSWLADFLGASEDDAMRLTVIDLSLVPSEIVHVVTAVIARVVFEALQRYRKLTGVALPTVLVMEEAHTFVKRYKDDLENPDAAAVCCQVFERIAREGRKFGLGLVLSSQRPSELSPTVLSQCNTFLLHRISNDRDQEIVHKLVPDNLRGLLRELPSLPAQQAILLGWATEIPVLVRMSDLPKEHRPHSADPDFWDVWTGQDAAGNSVQRPVDWKAVADDWQGRATIAATTAPGQNDTCVAVETEQHADVVDDDIPF